MFKRKRTRSLTSFGSKFVTLWDTWRDSIVDVNELRVRRRERCLKEGAGGGRGGLRGASDRKLVDGGRKSRRTMRRRRE